MSVVEKLLVREEALEVDLVPFDPSSWTGVPNWRVGYQDSIAVYLVRFALGNVVLKSMTHPGEDAISMREKHKRLDTSSWVLMTAQVFQTFYKNPKFFPQEWRTEEGDEILRVCFDGTEILSPEGRAHVACLYHHKGTLCWEFVPVTDEVRRRIPAAVIPNPFGRRETA